MKINRDLSQRDPNSLNLFYLAREKHAENNRNVPRSNVHTRTEIISSKNVSKGTDRLPDLNTKDSGIELVRVNNEEKKICSAPEETKKNPFSILKDDRATETMHFLKGSSPEEFLKLMKFEVEEEQQEGKLGKFNGRITNWKMYRYYRHWSINNDMGIQRGYGRRGFYTKLMCSSCKWNYDCFPSIQKRCIIIPEENCLICKAKKRVPYPDILVDYQYALWELFDTKEKELKNNRSWVVDKLNNPHPKIV